MAQTHAPGCMCWQPPTGLTSLTPLFSGDSTAPLHSGTGLSSGINMPQIILLDVWEGLVSV